MRIVAIVSLAIALAGCAGVGGMESMQPAGGAPYTWPCNASG
ncbi:MAG TPA: hypothetical protein VHP37_01530 [Burkholderiales bacterium]|nr:hypothetical protein [Burkholderiales bacterium]